MTISVGTRLGPYQVTAQIGAGGMGMVYRATDTTLDRSVAIKVLPDSFAADPERLARFEREAKTLASLNHPNIAQIYGFEKAGGTPALVMELVDGPTLADRIAYVAPNGGLMSVSITRAGNALSIGTPVALFVSRALRGAADYDVLGDDRFLLKVPLGEQEDISVTVIVNWSATMKGR